MDAAGTDVDFEVEDVMEIDSGLEAVGGVECMEVSKNGNDIEDDIENTQAFEGDTSTGNDIFFVDVIGDRGLTKTDALDAAAWGGNKSYSSVVGHKIRGLATPH